MIHIALHIILPLFAAIAFYRSEWRFAALILLGTMLVDIDHVLANPIYDPNRCSIGFHALHTTPALVAYAVLFLLPLALRRISDDPGQRRTLWVMHLLGLGLVIHMTLDWIDCIL